MAHRQRPVAHLFLRAFAATLVLATLAAAPASAAGKPGYPTTVFWGGATWQVKTSRSAVGPGPNVFAASNVWVDASTGDLHLGIARTGSGTWACSEVIGPTSHGYGTYTFVLDSRVDSLDPNVVLGLFTWSDRAPYAHREIDIELARWGTGLDPTNGQYVVQPASTANHLFRFAQGPSTPSIEQFTWRAGSVSWRTLDASGTTAASYSYSGRDVPVPGDERVHLNLWLYNGAAPANGAPVDVLVRSFTFTP